MSSQETENWKKSLSEAGDAETEKLILERIRLHRWNPRGQIENLEEQVQSLGDMLVSIIRIMYTHIPLSESEVRELIDGLPEVRS